MAATPPVPSATADAFRAWCLGHSGCPGGDPGSRRRPAIWVCGIEPGGSRSLPIDELARTLQHDDVGRPCPGYTDWHDNLAHSFTRRITKLLAAFEGGRMADYRAFAAAQRPFTRARRGYYRLNLYPLAFHDTDPARWTAGLAGLTGFARKADYLAWCDAQRLPWMRALARRHRPRLIVGLGKSWQAAFRLAFLEPDSALQQETVGGKSLDWAINADGALVAILPFLTSASGLQSDAALQAVGERLRELSP